MIPCPSVIGAEQFVGNAVLWLKLAVEVIGAPVIGIGMSLAGWRFSDILSTALAPTWDAIGKLAAVAVIRTALNCFLSRDMQDTRTPTSQA